MSKSVTAIRRGMPHPLQSASQTGDMGSSVLVLGRQWCGTGVSGKRSGTPSSSAASIYVLSPELWNDRLVKAELSGDPLLLIQAVFVVGVRESTDFDIAGHRFGQWAYGLGLSPH